MPTFKVSQGGPDIEDGTYPVVLIAIRGDEADPERPKIVIGRNDGKEYELWDWVFSLEGDGQDVEIKGTTSTVFSPKSKMYAYVTALLGGKGPQAGETFDNDQLVGRMALATVVKDDSGWPRITNLSPLPKAMRAQTVSRTLGTPKAGDDLPF